MNRFSGIFVLCFSFFAALSCTRDTTSKAEKEQDPRMIVTVDDVFSNPARYVSPVKMSGKIISIDDVENTFFLGCEDECIRIPVRYKGELSGIGNSVIATGQVITVGGKFMFNATKVVQK